MIPNAISSVTASHIKDLVADGISESRELDYKTELPTGADGRIGFLKDVAAFANTSGGDLVFGVDEEVDVNDKRTGRASAIPGLQNLDDAQKLRLEQWVRTGIEPRVYVQLHAVTELDNGPVLVVRVPRSLTGPHMVKDRSQFWARGNTGNYEMDVDQLRRAFLESHSLVERVANFHRERVQAMRTDQFTVPLVAGPAFTLHVVPIAGLSGEGIDLQLAKEAVLPPGGGGSPRFNLDGWMVEEPRHDGRSGGYVQVFRNGIIEGVECYGNRCNLPGRPANLPAGLPWSVDVTEPH